MDVEKLIPKREKVELPYLGSRYWRNDNLHVWEVYLKYEYLYGGRLFLIGTLEGSKAFYMFELETGAVAVSPNDFQKKPTVKMLIDKFKEKLRRSGKSIHEVIRDYKNNNSDLGLWLIDLLIT